MMQKNNIRFWVRVVKNIGTGYRVVLHSGKMVIFLVVVLLSLAPSLIASSRHKDVVDFDDADIERLYQQWEVLKFSCQMA